MTTQGGSYSWNAVCDVCGFQYKGQELRKRWDGLMVCKDDFETRHPLDFYRVKNDHHPLPFTRPAEVISTGFLPPTLDFYETPAGALVDTVGQRFTVGSSDRRLMAVKFVKGTLLDVEYPIGNLTLKLWDSGGTLLTSWGITTITYDREHDENATAIVVTSPVYTLEAGETYTISAYMASDNGLWYTASTPTAQPHLTWVGSYRDAADAFPNTAQATCLFMDVITGSTN